MIKSKYYQEIDRIEAQIANEVTAGWAANPTGYHQPKCTIVHDPTTGEAKLRPEHVWITSVQNFTANTTAGSICAALLRPAAVALLAGGHKLATAAEVEEFKAAGKRRLLDYQAEEARNKQRQEFRINLPPEVPAATRAK